MWGTAANNLSISPFAKKGIYGNLPRIALTGLRAHDACVGRRRYLFSLAAQFKTTDMGAVSACLTCVLIRNRCPSRLTS
jgi:hypothetical protein